jgi:hypothetical protein
MEPDYVIVCRSCGRRRVVDLSLLSRLAERNNLRAPSVRELAAVSRRLKCNVCGVRDAEVIKAAPLPAGLGVSEPPGCPDGYDEEVAQRRTRCELCNEQIRIGARICVASRTKRVRHRRCSSEAFIYYASGLSGRWNDIYHRSRCSWVAHLNKSELISFSSKEAAEFSGYRPCKHCRP